MTDRIKVFIQYPWIKPDSPYYTYLLDHTPEDIEYVNPLIRSKKIISGQEFLSNNQTKSKLRNLIFKSKIPLPNARYTFMTREADIIHCPFCISLNHYPWICDWEIWWQGMLSNVDNNLGIWITKKILQQKSCKKILCWSEETRKRMLEMFNNDKIITSKSIVVYQAVPVIQNNQMLRIHEKEVNLLFIARYFYAKGGKEAVELINQLTKKYKFINGYIISDTPKEILDKYHDNDQLIFLPVMDRQKLYNYYSLADIFIYPGISDSFGWMFLEAMSYGLPIITMPGYARREIVEDSVNGFVCKDPEDMFKKTESLVLNRTKRRLIGTSGFELVHKGKFSFEVKNKKLREIYGEAIKED